MLSWKSSCSDYETAAEREIADCYERAPPTATDSPSARRTSEDVVVKRVSFDEEHEFANLKLAWELLNGEQLRVPKPIRVFRLADISELPCGYLVMEYLDGLSLDVYCDEDSIRATSNAICYLHSRTREHFASHRSPGPLNGGPPDVFPWGLDGVEGSFATTGHLEGCANARLLRCTTVNPRRFTRSSTDGSHRSQDYILDLKDRALSLCHMDLALRNILRLADGSVALVDWSSLALYPSIFELASLSYLIHLTPLDKRGPSKALYSAVKASMVGLEQDMGGVEEDVRKLEIVQSISIRYFFQDILC